MDPIKANAMKDLEGDANKEEKKDPKNEEEKEEAEDESSFSDYFSATFSEVNEMEKGLEHRIYVSNLESELEAAEVDLNPSISC